MLVRAIIAKLKAASTRRDLGRAIRTGLGLLLTGHFRAFKAKLVSGDAEGGTALYLLWRERHALTNARRAAMRAEAEKMQAPPRGAHAGAPLRFSLLMAVRPGAGQHLRAALESAVRQVYPFWELCVVGDVAAEEGVRAVLEE
ncbi:MAG: hypothetical protein NTW87_03400, partial [Planctomycetota bacterium]|nr:hypothetical protein [Planctomycetota bacterium]